MKKNQVDAILVDSAKRKRKIISNACLSLLIFIISLFFLLIFLNDNKVSYIKYRESSNIDYNVFLKENQFFDEKYLEQNKQYIASLIDYIDANFNYNLNVDDKYIDYKYQYRIEAEVNVNDSSSGKTLYHHMDELVPETINFSNSKSAVNIRKNVKVDYNKYNDLIKRFVNIYNLKDAESTLQVKMYLKVLSECEDVKNSNKESVISLTIPLTTDTVGIDIESNLVDSNQDKVMACVKENNAGYVFLYASIFVFVIGVITLIYLVSYILKTRTAESIYHRELKKILNNYKSYIQKINSSFNMRGYQALKVDSFYDMLEIRDTIQQPILMVENDDNTGAYFVIPSNTKILYIYSLKVSDIKNGKKI